jgi:hypothetical protein
MSHYGDEIFDNYKHIWDIKISLIKEKYPIDVLFLYSDDKIENDYIVVGNKLISKCIENYWTALLTKVMNGFDYFKNNNYDLVFKTNLSTIINFDKFYEYCSSINTDEIIYQGVTGSYLDYVFCSGAGMLLNQKIC